MTDRIIDGDAFLEKKDIGLRVKIDGKLYALLNVNVLGEFIAYTQKIKDGDLQEDEMGDVLDKPYQILHEMVADCPMAVLRRFSTQKAIALAGHLIGILHAEALELGAKLPGRLGGIENGSENQEVESKAQEAKATETKPSPIGGPNS